MPTRPPTSEGVFQQPVEGAPVRMHLDAPFKRLVVRVEQIGVAAADMRQAEDVAFLAQHGVQRLDVQRIQVRV